MFNRVKLCTLITAAGFCCLSAAGVTPALAQDTTPAPSTAPDYSAFILTPPAPHTPRINGPSIYGERPGRPFLYCVPATGDRPMNFSASNLPTGLKLDAATGRITGAVAKSGRYSVTLKARNALGTGTKILRIVIGDTIALTPPLGWNSWNSWAWSVDQPKVLRSARAMVAHHLNEHGWTYVNIDDTWQGKPNPTTHALEANERFPDIKGLIDTIHGMGLKAGIYSTPWIGSYGMYPGGSADGADRTWNAPPPNNRFPNPNPYHTFGTISFAKNDADEWARWGFDYLKYDWNPNDVPHVQQMALALKGSGRDFVFSLSNAAPFGQASDWAHMANAWRTTGDIAPNYESVCANGFTQSRWAPYSGPGHWNDADMMEVGYVGWGNPKPTDMNAQEQYTHVSLWCLLTAPLLIGCDMERLDSFTTSLLSNDEVLAIDQDPAGKAAVRVSEAGGDITITGPAAYASHGETASITLPRLQAWAKPLEDGSTAVGLFNLGDAPDQITASFSDLKLTGPQTARDLWRQKNLGRFIGGYTATVPSHGVVLVKITPTK